MKIYLVWGVEFHGDNQLFGVYDSWEAADKRLKEVTVTIHWFDKFEIQVVDINTDLN